MNESAPSKINKINFTDEQKKVLKKTIAKGASDDELEMFVQVCLAYNLNPFKKEIFFSKSKETGKVEFITSRDGYLTLAQRDLRYLGIISMEVYSKDGFSMEFDSTDKGKDSDIIYDVKIHHKINSIQIEERGELIGAWATCYFKDRVPATVFVYLDEYKKMGYKNWDKYTSAMIRKVAESIVLKRQGGFSGLVTEEEVGMLESPPSEGMVKYVESEVNDQEHKQYPGDATGDGDKKQGAKELNESDHKPQDVTDKYTFDSHDSEGEEVETRVILTAESDTFTEYTVDNRIVYFHKDTNTYECVACKSDNCKHVKYLKLYIEEPP